MQQKTILILLAVATLSSVIGGGAVFLATSKSNSSQVNTSKNSKSLSSVNVSEATIDSKSSTVAVGSSSGSAKTESSQISSQLPKSSLATKTNDEKPAGQKFAGWIGSMETEMYLVFNNDKITGKYYDSFDKKWYNLDGIFRQNIDSKEGVIELSELDNNINVGTFSIMTTKQGKYSNNKESELNYSQNNSYSNSIPSGLYYTKTLETLLGFYTNKKGVPYDFYVSSNNDNIDQIKTDITKEFVVRKLDNGQPFESTIFEENGRYYFTIEDWKIPKDIKVGDKVSVTGKVRTYNNQYGFNISQEPDYKYESTNQGFFQIKEVKKI
jgi:predicted extracellular nuclease